MSHDAWGGGSDADPKLRLKELQELRAPKPANGPARRNSWFVEGVLWTGFAVLLSLGIYKGVSWVNSITSEQHVEPMKTPKIAREVTDNVDTSDLPREQMGVSAGSGYDCGLVNGQRKCFARGAESFSASIDESASMRNARALAIMESTRSRTTGQASQRDGRYNQHLAAAEQACEIFHDRGSIDYRHCRGRRWQELRRGCVWERERNIHDGEWCDAERRFIVPA